MGLVWRPFLLDRGRGRRNFLAEAPPPLNKEAISDGLGLYSLIVFVAAKIKEIFALGRTYPWPKPKLCPRCKASKVWGHGWVLGFFDGFDEGLWLRRYRCPGCGCVLKLRPDGYFPRFQASIEAIRTSLSHRIERGRWPPFPSPSRQRHWMRALRRKTEAYLGRSFSGTWMDAFEWLISRGQVAVSRSI
jgi:hypothetical protein